MSKLILSTGLGFDVPTLEQIKIFGEVGWDGVFTDCSADRVNEDYAKALYERGMIYQSTHAPFGRVDTLWEEGEDGDTYADELVSCLNNTADAGVNLMILHAIIGMEKCTPTELGLRRFEKIFNAAEKRGVTVALENTEGEIYVEYLMEHFGSSDKVGFCIDTGHEMCYNARRDIIGKYANKLCCTHLNDNMGQTEEKITWHDDSHLLPFDGTADWNGIADRLKKAGYDRELTFELTSRNKPNRNTHDIYSHLDLEGFAALALERAKRFAELMQK
jgi:sugar phosphate isomerase/epimerase